MNERKIPELLSPVGGMEQLRAAVQNGADAVYMGGSRFNARIKAKNFNAHDMRTAIDYAHERNVKIYITLNTLIKDSELADAFSYVNFLYGIGADAVILQDMGLARLIRKYMPDMPMHLSTQGTVYNKWAVGTAKRLGFSRIVPARELSLDEIEEFANECHQTSAGIDKQTNGRDGSGAGNRDNSSEKTCEIEVFIHGALCMCYSGQCQMSRALGNNAANNGNNVRSGNRGMCAQPCRLPYKDSEGRRSFLLSPKDICTVEVIPELCRAGVDSFKIEGRLKSPQYVAVVTGIYRKYLDMYRDEGYVKVEAGDMRALLQIFNRGGFSKGYLFENPGQRLLSGASPKNRGLYLGKVTGFKKGSTLIDIDPIIALDIGDGIEVQSKEPTGNVVSYLKELPGGLLRVGDIKGKVNIGDKVYKVTDKRQLKDVEKTYADDSQKKLPVELYFTAKIGSLPKLNIREADTNSRSKGVNCHPRSASAVGTSPVELARSRATETDRVKEQLMKLGNTPFTAVKTEIFIDEGVIIPISTINKMRREAVDKLLQYKRCVERIPLPEEALQKICADEKLGEDTLEENLLRNNKAVKKLHQNSETTENLLQNSTVAEKPLQAGAAFNAERCPSLYIYSREELANLPREVPGGRKPRLYVPLEFYMKGEIPDDTEIIPYILNVSRGNLDKYIEEHFSDIIGRVKTSGIMIGNLGWIEQFLAAGVPVYGDYGLNVYNRQAERCFEELGVEVRAYSHEFSSKEGYWAGPGNICGNMPLMITEHPLLTAEMSDRRNEKYRVVQSGCGDKYLIFKV